MKGGEAFELPRGTSDRAAALRAFGAGIAATVTATTAASTAPAAATEAARATGAARTARPEDAEHRREGGWSTGAAEAARAVVVLPPEKA